MAIVNVVNQALVSPAGVTYTHNGVSENNPPRAGFLGDAAIEGLQSIPNLARGNWAFKIGDTEVITGITNSNRNQVHICEPVGVVTPKRTTIRNRDGIEVPNLALGAPGLELYIKFKESTIIQDILSAIASAEAAALAEFNPLLTQIKNLGFQIAQKIREINKIIENYVITALLIVQVEQYISLLIKFITSLPAIFAQALAECLSALKNALGNALSAAFGVDTGGLITEIRALQSNLSLAESATQQVVAGAQQIITDIQNVPTGITKGADILLNTIKSLKNSGPPKPTVVVALF
jgi:hypothetical protein